MIEMHTLRKLVTEQFFTEAHFEAMLQLVDRLHDAAAVGKLETATPLDARTVIGWLDDIIFTAEETIRELQAMSSQQEPADEFEGWSGN